MKISDLTPQEKRLLFMMRLADALIEEHMRQNQRPEKETAPQAAEARNEAHD